MDKKEWIVLVGLLLGTIGLGAFFAFGPNAPEVAGGPVDVGGGTLAIQNQDDLTTVHVSTTLVVPGFVTIHASLGSAPATIIGTSAYVPAGTYPDLVISLSTPMKPDYSYIGLLHADDGDGVFTVQGDMPVKTNGTVVRADFISSTNPQ